MGLAAKSIDLIRSFFNRGDSLPNQQNYYGVYGNYALGQSNAGLSTSVSNSILDSLILRNDLMSKYADYENMQDYPEIGTALMIFADEATQADVVTNRTLWWKTEDNRISEMLDETFNKRLEIETTIWDKAYALCQYGNTFDELVVQDQIGVIKSINYPAPEVRRIEDRTGELYGFIADPSLSFTINADEFNKRLRGPDGEIGRQGSNVEVFEPWEMVHTRLKRSGVNQLYGMSLLDQARWAWRRLSWMEDAMVVSKLTRAAQRYVFYVDVGDIPPNEARAELNKYKNDFRKQKIVGPDGKINFKFNPLSVDEDFFIARRKDKRTTEIETLNGLDGQQVEDTEYFRNKLVSALQIPKSYLGYDDTVSRSNIGQQDIRLAISVLRVQRAMKTGFKQIAQVDLSARNIDPDSVEFEPMMVIPSGALEISHIEVKQAQANLAQQFQGLNFSEHYIYSKIMGLTDDEIAEVISQRAQETGVNTEEYKYKIKNYVDKQSSLTSQKEMDQNNRILDNIEKGSSDIYRHMNDLRSLAKELRYNMSTKSKR